MNLTNCEHIDIYERNCMKCGAYVYKEMNVVGLKSEIFYQMIESAASLKNIKKKSLNVEKRKSNYSLKVQSKQVFSLLMSRLMISRQTYALAVYMLENHAERILQKSDFSEQICLKLISISCFILAMKVLEIKYKVPKIQDLKRILRIQIDKNQLLMIQMDIIIHNKSVVTFLDFINYYLTNGGVFSFQNIRQPEIFQTKLNNLCWQKIKNGSFLNHNQQQLAVYLLYRTRKQFKFTEIWNWHIEYYTQISHCQALQISSWPLQSVNHIINNPSSQQCILNSQCRKNYILNIQQSLEKIRKSYNKIRNEAQSPTPRMQSVKSASSINKRCFRVE